MNKQEWTDSYKKLIEEAMQFAPCQKGDLVEWNGSRYNVSEVRFKFLSSDEIKFDIRGFKIKKDGTPSQGTNEIWASLCGGITVIETA